MELLQNIGIGYLLGCALTIVLFLIQYSMTDIKHSKKFLLHKVLPLIAFTSWVGVLICSFVIIDLIKAKKAEKKLGGLK